MANVYNSQQMGLFLQNNRDVTPLNETVFRCYSLTLRAMLPAQERMHGVYFFTGEMNEDSAGTQIRAARD